MEAFEFVKARGRMCNVCQTCVYCPLDYTGYCSVAGKCRTDEQIERAIEIVEKWAKEHPLRTRQSEFLKMFPTAKLDENGVIIIDPCCVDSNYGIDKDKTNCCTNKTCDECAREFWITPLEEEG